MPYVLPSIPEFKTENIDSVTVLIPVYNGIQHLKNLLPSLIKNTPNSVQIIIIDDCSSDVEVQNYLTNYSQYENIKLIKNESNLGFVKTVNKGMSLINTKFAVWLNSDTIVPEYWLERLLYPFDGSNKIATTTPFTNSGCTFSFPLFCRDNEVQKSVDVVDKCFQRVHNFDTSLNETYSGTGFCMAMCIDCWNDIGGLDEKNFGKGYGEENDWCFRALQKGYKHYLVPNLFVQHCHGGSFIAEEKRNLIKNHLNILKKNYPKIMNEIVPEFMKKDPWINYRELLSVLFCNNAPILIIDAKLKPSTCSGAYVYRQDLIKNLKSDGHDVLILQYSADNKNEWSLVPESCSNDIEIKLKNFAEIKILFELLPVKNVIVNNFAFLKNVENTINILCELKKIYSFCISYKFHDYLSVCPSFFLLNSEGENCNNPNENVCTECLINNKFRTIKRTEITYWRKIWQKFFMVVDEFNFFSEYTYNIVRKYYPIVDKNFNIKEHIVEFSQEDSKYIMPKTKNVITFAFVGNYCHAKGAHYFEALSELYKSVGFKTRFIVIGKNNYKNKSRKIKYISSYTRQNLGKILTDNNVHIVIYPSINNETFSYVAQELMLLKVPLVIFNNGAHQERIRKYKYESGVIAKEISVEGLFNAANYLLNKVYAIKKPKTMKKLKS